jgi:hypothetical protein
MKNWLLVLLLAVCTVAIAPSTQAFQLSGSVTGTQGFHLCPVIAVPLPPDTFYLTDALPILNTYLFANLDAGNYLIFAYDDLDNNALPSLDDPRGFYGGNIPTLFALQGDSSGVVIELHPPNQGAFSGRISYDGRSTGTTIIEAHYDAHFDAIHGGGVMLGSLTGGNFFNNTGNGNYTALVDSFTTFYVMAFMDMNTNFRHDADEPFGLFGGDTARSITIEHTNFPDSVNIVLHDPSSVGDRPLPVAERSALGSAYPNPFNSQTVIPFELKTAGKVELSVCDITGRVVRNLASGSYSAGAHTILFSADNLASGLYMVRLNSGTGNVAKRVVLVR